MKKYEKLHKVKLKYSNNNVVNKDRANLKRLVS